MCEMRNRKLASRQRKIRWGKRES